MTKKITYQRLYNITLYYLSRYDACAGKVRDMLKRRLQRISLEGQEIPSEAHQWIEQVIMRMIELGYVNDKRYAENQFRRLSEAGKSARFITMKLMQAGVDPSVIEVVFQADEYDDLERAKALVSRKKIGYFRPQSERLEYFKKDLMMLGRAGFSYETARKVLQENDEF